MGTKVMLVDDEQGFVEAMSRRLGKRNMEVSSALSGQEALNLLDTNTGVEVVILDVKMPGMDGIETLKRIKTEHPLVEVIMLTGHATVETAIEGMKRGAYDYLMKPCDIDELVGKVKSAAAKKSDHEQRINEARAQNIALRRGD